MSFGDQNLEAKIISLEACYSAYKEDIKIRWSEIWQGGSLGI